MRITEASLEWLENPGIFQVNRIKAHSDHFFYEKETETSLKRKNAFAPVSERRMELFLQ